MPRRSGCETESRHVVVVDPKDLLTGESDRIVIGVAALNPRRLEQVQLIRRSRVLGYERFEKYVVAHNAVRMRHARAHREEYHQRENYFPPHKHHRGHFGPYQALTEHRGPRAIVEAKNVKMPASSPAWAEAGRETRRIYISEPE